MKKRIINLILTAFFFLIPLNLSAGIMEIPRKVYVISTEHFEILFSEPSATTAKVLGDNAEQIYQETSISFDYYYPLKITVIISPDSDTLSAQYTVLPFNRIVVFDSVPSMEQIENYKSGLLDMFRHEVERAVSRSVTDKFLYIMRKDIFGKALQPAALLNIPFSFLEGAVSAEDEKYNTGILSDGWNLQTLVQAKIDGKFPDLIQVLGTKDTYPGTDFCKLAASAFCAYIQQRWGYEKFLEYWEAGGKVNFFFLHNGIFKKVYGISLEQAWQDFSDEIPVPQIPEDESEIFMKTNNASFYKFILHSKYGYIWYDDLKSEVDIYDDTLGFQKFKRLLFMASDVNNLALSPDGRFIIVSHTQKGSRTDFDTNKARIFDLKTREFTGDTFDLKNASIVQLKNGAFAAAGIDVSGKVPEFKVFLANKTNSRLGYAKSKNQEPVFTRSYTLDSIPENTVYAGTGKTAVLISTSSQKFISIINLETSEEENLQIKYEDEILDIKNLRFNDISFLELSKVSAPYVLMFDYLSKFENSFCRTGMILFNKDDSLKQVIVQAQDVNGGINSAFFYGPDYYYSSHKSDHDEFRKIPVSKIQFESAEAVFPNIVFPDKSAEPVFTITQGVNEKNKKQLYLDEYPVKTFSPFKYMVKGAWQPFMPVKTVSFSEGIEQWPGLGVAFTSGADPFSNNELTLSAGFGFLPMDFSMYFNATEEERRALRFEELSFFDDYTFAAYYKNSVTPVDFLASSLMKFDMSGHYNLDVLGGLEWEIPLMMTFRRFTFDAEAKFTASTSYWDPLQLSTYPDLSDWPLFSDSYRSIQMIGIMEYSNVHQYGISPYKKMGVTAGVSLTATWDINLMELQAEKQKSGTVVSVKPENLTQAIENQLWGNPYAPTQINAGLYGTAEIPQLLPVQTTDNWILCLPATIYGELFYTNGVALELDFKTMVLGKEIQNGFNKLNVYFPRAGFYIGYDIKRLYDTNTVVLPDVRDFTRFYDAFTSTYLSDSVYANLNLYVTPVVGKFSSFQIISDLKLAYYLRSNIWELKFNFKCEF